MNAECELVWRPLDNDLCQPLVLDLDGTLFATDSLYESLFVFLKKCGRSAWKIPVWVFRGRACVKSRLAGAVADEDIARLPVNDDLVAFAQREACRGRRVVLATAADILIAQKVASRFPFIAEVVASGQGVNLKGEAKVRVLERRFPDGFIYAGDSRPDLHVWRGAAGAVFVGNSARLQARIAQLTTLIAVIPRKTPTLGTLRRGLRLHQWAKNALIFVPLILGGKATDAVAWIQGMVGFVALGLLASATYLVNDMWDLADDRQHWAKKHRPLASGELPISLGLGMIAIGGFSAFALAGAIGQGCVLVLLFYLFLSVLYSFRLKREPIIDVFLLALLFTLRLALGVVVTGVAFSPWLFVFSMFVFLSLSLAKRQTEITRMIAHGHTTAPGRGYSASDAPLVLSIGVGTMMATVLIMIIYLFEDAFPKGFYQHSYVLWGLPMVLFLWLGRVWLFCHRGELHDDPVAFALKDRISLFYGAVMVVVFITAVL